MEGGKSLHLLPQQGALFLSGTLSAVRVCSRFFFLPFGSKGLDQVLEVERDRLVPDSWVVEKMGTDTGLADLDFCAETDECGRLAVAEIAEAFAHILQWTQLGDVSHTHMTSGRIPANCFETYIA